MWTDTLWCVSLGAPSLAPFFLLFVGVGPFFHAGYFEVVVFLFQFGDCQLPRVVGVVAFDGGCAAAYFLAGGMDVFEIDLECGHVDVLEWVYGFSV